MKNHKGTKASTEEKKSFMFVYCSTLVQKKLRLAAKPLVQKQQND